MRTQHARLLRVAAVTAVGLLTSITLAGTAYAEDPAVPPTGAPVGGTPVEPPTTADPATPADPNAPGAPAAPATPADPATPAPASTVQIRFDAVVNGDGVVIYRGSAFDANDPTAKLNVSVTVDGEQAQAGVANEASPELSQYGIPSSGISGSLSIVDGQHDVCLTATDIAGATVAGPCKTVDIASESPRGEFGVDVQGSEVIIQGWALDDSDQTQSLPIVISDNGKIVVNTVANLETPNLAAGFGIPGNHAFMVSYTPSESGDHRICYLADNVGAGHPTWIDCQTVSVDITADNPKGVLKPIVDDPDGNGKLDLFAYGMAYDPNDLSAQPTVTFILDGVAFDYAPTTADSTGLNPEGVTGNHGYLNWIGEIGTNLLPGPHTMCTYSDNVGRGEAGLVDCVEFTM